MIWFASDTHWGHANVVRYAGRPYSDVLEMGDALVDNWNACVAEKDTVWHLGDFAFANRDGIRWLLERLNGTKHLVLGNHDRLIRRRPHMFIGDDWFASIQTYSELKTDPPIVLSHYGMRVWNRSHYGSIHLYGHSHGTLPPHGRSVDVGVDCKEITDEYRPVSLDEVMAYMAKREVEVVDHHGSDRD